MNNSLTKRSKYNMLSYTSYNPTILSFSTVSSPTSSSCFSGLKSPSSSTPRPVDSFPITGNKVVDEYFRNKSPYDEYLLLGGNFSQSDLHFIMINLKRYAFLKNIECIIFLY